MKRLFVLTIGILVAAQLMAADVLQNVYGRATTSLNGWWQIIVDPYDTGMGYGIFKNEKAPNASAHVEYDFSSKEYIDVPADWNTQRNDLFFYEGTVWYKRDFECHLKKDKLLYLYFGGANYQTDVWLNGQKVGSHEGGFTPFFFDVTNLVQKGGNTVVVRVNNHRRADAVPAMETDWWNFGGLTRDVMLVETPMAHIDDYEVRLEEGSLSKVFVKVKLNLPVADVKVDVKIDDLKLSKRLITDRNGEASFTYDKKAPILWTPEIPRLYDVELKCNGEKITDQIGFRHIEVRGSELLLNGKPIFLRGVSVHEEAPYRTGRCIAEKDDSTLISWSKFLGANFLRLAHYPHNEKMVRMAERFGIMLWSEIPVYWNIDWTNEKTYACASRQLKEVMNRDHNRCGVIIWSIGNETPKSEARDEFLRKLGHQVKQYDNERLLSMAMTIDNAGENISTINDNLLPMVDIIGVNEYIGWYGGTADDCNRRQWTIPTGKPIIVTEFGAGAVAGRFGDRTEKWTEEYQAEVFRRQLAMWSRQPGFVGVSPWVLMDFHSPRRLNHDTQNYFNRKGIISERGQTKQAFYVLQDFYKQKGAFKHLMKQ